MKVVPKQMSKKRIGEKNEREGAGGCIFMCVCIRKALCLGVSYTCLFVPLDFPASDELVDDDLCPISKVSKLSLPYTKRVRMLERVTELVAHR